MNITTIDPTDYHAIFDLQNSEHPEFLCESLVVLTSKVYYSPDTCFIINNKEGNWGYILALPYTDGKTIPRDKQVPLPDNPDVMMIYDCIVNRFRRGNGYGTQLVRAVEKKAAQMGFSKITVVALEGSFYFWKRLGYTLTEHSVGIEYGDDAVFAEKILK